MVSPQSINYPVGLWIPEDGVKMASLTTSVRADTSSTDTGAMPALLRIYIRIPIELLDVNTEALMIQG